MSICGTGNKSCAICGNARSGGCIITMREDYFCLASERQLVERLNKNEYPEKRDLMISTLKVEYNHEYAGYEELKPLPKQLNCCTQARYSRDSEGKDRHMYFEEAIIETITKGRKIAKVINTERGAVEVGMAIAYDPDMNKIRFWYEEADKKGSHYGGEVAFTDTDRTSNQWCVIPDLPKIMVNCRKPAESLCSTCRKIFSCPFQSNVAKNSCEMYEKLPNPLDKIIAKVVEGAEPPLMLNGSLSAGSLCPMCKNLFTCSMRSTASIVKSCEKFVSSSNLIAGIETPSIKPIKEEKNYGISREN